ncbi:DUF3383 family protein [Anaerosolibacter sp.]|uniref:DUF3383 family protein n=1 Tax=Anaerosolibacter sp. TaxID=1872527 RepID=UPI0039EE4676
MPEIKDVVVIITRETQALSQQGFGMPLILATNADKAYKEYLDLPSVAQDYAEDTEAYKMANKIFGQTPKPEKIAIYSVVFSDPVAATLTTNITGLNNDLKYTAKLPGAAGNNISIEYIDPEALTASTTASRAGSGTALDPYVITVTLQHDGTNIVALAADVKAAIEADANSNTMVTVVNADGNDGTGIVTELAETPLTGGINASDVTILTSALNTLVQTKNDWYVLLCDRQGDAEITALGEWINAQKKLYFAATSNKNLVATLESDRTIIMYHDAPTSYPECGWVGRCLPELPGSITWKFKTINGILPVDIGVTDLTQLHDDGGNTYLTKFGINQSSEGLVSSGEYIDIIQSQDFIEARMTENVSRLLMTTKKVPYDNTGIAMIVAEVEKTLKQAAGQGIIAVDDDGNYQYKITYKRRNEIPANDIASRKLTGISWTAVVAGAVHTVEIRGTLTINEL